MQVGRRRLPELLIGSIKDKIKYGMIVKLLTMEQTHG